MAILDELLGNGDQQSASANESWNDSSASFSPELGFATGKILDFGTSSEDGGDGDMSATHFTGIGGIALGVSAPIEYSASSSSESADYSNSDSDGGGLLGGLL